MRGPKSPWSRLRWGLAALLLALGPSGARSQEAPASLALSEAERRALEFSPALKAADDRIRVEEGRLRQVGLYPNPDLALDGSWQTNGQGSRETVLSFRQPIPYPSARDLLRQEAQERVETARGDRDRERLDLLQQVRASYGRLYFAAAFLKVEEEDLEATRALEKAAEARVATGDAPPFESLKAAVEVSRAEGEVGRARGELRAETASFSLLLGQPAETPTMVEEPPSETGMFGNLPDLLARALEKQPEVLAVHHEALAAEFAAALAHIEKRPEVALGPSLGTDHGETFVGAGVSLKLPLWNRNQGNIAAASAASDEARAREGVVRLAISRQVTESYQRYQSAREQRAAFEQGLLDASARMLEKARQAYQGGETGILEFLDARRTALAVREEYLHASLDAVLAAAQLRRALGEDMQDETSR
ncbi:MAG TPA: TolC family protein [Candidatus Polarisedimenticolia bacterium]|nr:TolC family protein [Candidatus Polarisedimenticolia bacterium]